MIKKIIPLLIIVAMLCSCASQPEFYPQVSYEITSKEISSLPQPFPELSFDEKNTDWAKEYTIGKSFAKKLDLYRSITSFERALVLLPPEKHGRRLELQYDILKCYFVGEKYSEVIKIFESSSLANANPAFPAFRDLIIMLHESYKKIGDADKASKIMQLLEAQAPKTAQALQLSGALTSGDLHTLERSSKDYSYLPAITKKYRSETKSVTTAQMLNLIPGLGYLYVGQKKSAMTSFLLNSLFIAAAYHFFDRGDIAAGVITTGFEFGWYAGGVTGAGLAANQYNEHLYSKYANKIAKEEKLFPILILKYGF
jgi:tetratricopeptide (TPR) repeat protein